MTDSRCGACGALSGADHKPDCNTLALLRVAAYPHSLDLNGRLWWMNKIDELTHALDQARAERDDALRQLAEIKDEATNTIYAPRLGPDEIDLMLTETLAALEAREKDESA